MNNEMPDHLTPLEEEILLALRLGGDLAPETAAEVYAAEKTWDSISENDLPESLKNAALLAAKIIANDADNIVDIAPSAAEQELERDLARAARFGGAITDDVEARMKADKARAREAVQENSFK